MTEDLEPTNPGEPSDPGETTDLGAGLPDPPDPPTEAWVASHNGLTTERVANGTANGAAGLGVFADAGGDWVEHGTGETERAPGIDDVQETTYVEPHPRPERWRVLVGAGLALGGIAVFIALVFVARARDDNATNGRAIDVSRTTLPEPVTSTSKPAPSSTTTAAGPATAGGTGTSSTTTTTAGGAVIGSTINAPTGSGATPPPTAAPAPTPPATADPALPAYVPVPIPAGVTATLGGCSWQPGNGGSMQASGTITGVAAKPTGWQITVRWLQNNRELAEQATHIAVAVGATAPWSLSISAPVGPADLSCAVEVG
jgi:hypothetical protein